MHMETAEKAHKVRDEELFELMQKISERLDSIELKTNVMYAMFDSVSGFNKISIWILKFLAAIGAGIVGLLALLELFKKISK